MEGRIEARFPSKRFYLSHQDAHVIFNEKEECLTWFWVAPIPARKITCPASIALVKLMRTWERGSDISLVTQSEQCKVNTQSNWWFGAKKTLLICKYQQAVRRCYMQQKTIQGGVQYTLETGESRGMVLKNKLWKNHEEARLSQLVVWLWTIWKARLLGWDCLVLVPSLCSRVPMRFDVAYSRV